MAIFDNIELEWEGVPYKLSGDNKIMKVIAAVEEYITLQEIFEAQNSGNAPLAKIAGAFATMLRYAGAGLTDAEVYKGMWQNIESGSAVQDAVIALLSIMIPPGTLDEESEQESDGELKNSQSPAKKKTGGKQSKQHTKQQS